MSLLLELLKRRGVHYVIEQPRSSLMFEHPRLARVLAKHKAERVNCDLGCFGAETLKPVMFVGTAPYLAKLGVVAGSSLRKRLQTKTAGKKTGIVYFDKRGKKRVVGSKLLKKTQSYPAGLGLALGLAMQEHGMPGRSRPRNAVGDADSDSGSSCDGGYCSDHDCLADVESWEPKWVCK